MITGADSNASAAEAQSKRGATKVLRKILQDIETTSPSATADHGESTARLGDVLDRMDERAFGLLLLLLALPCCLPFIYLLPQIVALPMLALAGQLAAGKNHPWLPKKLHDRSFTISSFRTVLNKSEKYIGWFEKLARPRLRTLTSKSGARIVGALLLIPTASILVPLPSTNTIPGIGVAIASLGLIERDGILVILGLVIGLIWVALLGFLSLEAAHFIEEWLSARL